MKERYLVTWFREASTSSCCSASISSSSVESLINIPKWNHLWFTKHLVVEHRLNGLREEKNGKADGEKRHELVVYVFRVVPTVRAAQRRSILSRCLTYKSLKAISFKNLLSPSSRSFASLSRSLKWRLGNLAVAFVSARIAWWLEGLTVYGCDKESLMTLLICFRFSHRFFQNANLYHRKVTRDEEKAKTSFFLKKEQKKETRRKFLCRFSFLIFSFFFVYKLCYCVIFNLIK